MASDRRGKRTAAPAGEPTLQFDPERLVLKDSEHTVNLVDEMVARIRRLVEYDRSPDAGMRQLADDMLRRIAVCAVRGEHEARFRALLAKRVMEYRARLPRSLDPTKQRVQNLMKQHKRSGQTFKEFMGEWTQARTLDDLSIEDVAGKYEVTDDRSPSAVAKEYKLSTLEVMYSASTS